MSFLDKMTKAVGDVVDKGKKDVDQFMRIQKINGEISGLEAKIADFKSQIQKAKVAAGEKALEMVKAGTLSASELLPFVEQVGALDGQIAEQQAAIEAKRADIAKIKAEGDVAAAAAAAPAAPAATEAAASSRTCPQCGATVASGAFCGECGAKLA